MWKNKINVLLLLAMAVLVAAFAMWGPEKLAQYQDQKKLNQVAIETVESFGEGYRYSLGANEKLYILSKCLNSQEQPESEINAMTRVESEEINYGELTGAYAFVVNRQGPSEREIKKDRIYEVCNEELQKLYEKGVLPDPVKEVSASAYEATLYSAIDVLEPRNNVSVWKISLATGKQNADKSGRMLDAYIDADTGRIYEFYVRTQATWQKMEQDEMISAWAEYLGLSGQEDYGSDNPLLENTPYYKKYRFAGIDEGTTVVTIGFYEGINELYVKISK